MRINVYVFFQYTDWENLNDDSVNQKVLGDIVGDYFFVCPTNLFANVFAEQGGNVYYYFFTQVGWVLHYNACATERVEVVEFAGSWPFSVLIFSRPLITSTVRVHLNLLAERKILCISTLIVSRIRFFLMRKMTFVTKGITFALVLRFLTRPAYVIREILRSEIFTSVVRQPR